MSRILKASTAVVATAAVSVGAFAAFAGPAHADYERDREFRVGGAEVDFGVELDDRRYDVDVDIDDARPGSRWKVVIRHNGSKIHSQVHRADSDGEVDIDKTRSNTSGKDRFKVTVKPVGKKGKSRTIVMR